ncbi:hypothetical protein BD410DRAFT_810612 [Rickenella mellea]|uniref:Zn(2)-C6 fungal-type domain-containing protein n=1 Tax=Rickenella mellea TaxID=50990 RepID=A0A4Y7PEE6_9AGAM|nr:hypothetical protein BD410DRAFT_810612 [Rickenella mellea]
MEDDESETSRSESSEPEVSSRKRPREDDADDAPADLPTTSSGKVQPQVFIARADHSRPTPTPPITVQGPKAKRLKSDTPVVKEDTGNGTVETGDDGSADWTYRDKEGKLVTKHYDPVRGESCRRCTMQRLNCLVILSEKTTSIACMACTRGKSGCSFVTDRKEAKGLASGKSTGNVHAAKKTNAKKTEVTRIKMEKHGSTQKAMTKASSSGLRQPETRSSSVGSGNDSVVAEKSLGLGPKVDMLNRKEIAAKKALEEASSALRAAVQDVAEKEGEYLQASEDAKQAMVDYGKWQKRRKL